MCVCVCVRERERERERERVRECKHQKINPTRIIVFPRRTKSRKKRG